MPFRTISGIQIALLVPEGFCLQLRVIYRDIDKYQQLSQSKLAARSGVRAMPGFVDAVNDSTVLSLCPRQKGLPKRRPLFHL